MPLLINELVYDENNFKFFYQSYSTLKETCNQWFLSKPIQLIDSPKFLFVSQGEYCIVNKNDENIDWIGSDEATTCCLMFLETHSSLSVAHLDNRVKLDSLIRLVNELLEISNLDEQPIRLNCRLVGSYNDESQCSIKFLYKFLIYLNNIPNVQIDLTFACLLEMNTKTIYKNDKKYNCPITYGAAINLKEQKINNGDQLNHLIELKNNQLIGQNELQNLETSTQSGPPPNKLCMNQPYYDLIPAEFKDRGPEIVLRKARQTCQMKDLVQVYNSKTKIFIINEFRYFKINNIDLLINANDQYILDNFSTSPHVEPPHFVDLTRQVFLLMKNNKLLEQTHRFKRELDGSWSEIL